MTSFDPYHKWLGIPADQQPANYYRLLGIEEFEADADVIDSAAQQRTVYLRSFQAGPNAELAEQLLNEVSAARVCLLDGKSKALYDTQLRTAQQAVTEDDPLSLMTEELAAISSKPSTQSQSRSGKPIWQQPWAISMGAVGIVVVLLLVIVFFGSGDTYISSPTTKSLPASLQMGLIAYYPFNGNANDESGNGHHGEVHGSETFITVRRGASTNIFFSAKGEDYITVEDHADLNLGNETEKGLTISLWFYGNSPNDKCLNGIFVSKMMGKGIASSMVDYALVLEVEDEYGLIWGTGPSRGFGGSNSTSWMLSGVNPSSNTWHHLLVSYQSTSADKLKRIFLDGALIKEGGIGTKNTANNGPVKIGPWNGSIDDIRIYNRALSEAEVKALYEFEKP